jgi:hypothetical protein
MKKKEKKLKNKESKKLRKVRKVLEWFGKIVAVIIFLVPLYGQAADIVTNLGNNSRATKDRKLVLTSDGKLVAFYSKDSTGGVLCYKISEDAGATWGPEVVIDGSDWSSSWKSSVWKMNNNDIYVVYCNFARIKMVKMTYSGGVYTSSTPVTVVINTRGGEGNPSIAVEETSPRKIWINYVYYNSGTNKNELHVTYSTDEGSTWNGNDSSNPADEPPHYLLSSDIGYGRCAMIIWNGKPAVFYQGSSWSYYTSGSDTWSAWQNTGIGGFEFFSVCVTNNNYIHVVSGSEYDNVRHAYYNGTVWSLPNTLQATTNGKPSLTTDGINLWCFYSTDGNLVYKKYNGINWDTNYTLMPNGTGGYKPATPFRIVESNAIIPVFWYYGSASPYTIKFGKLGLPPKVTDVSPATGENSTTKTITITGQGFFGEVFSNDVLSIKLDDNFNTDLNISSATISDLTISNVIVPSGIKVGTYNIKVTTNKGTNTTSSVKFAVTTNVIPTVTNLVPSRAGNTGTTEITIYGTGFFGGTTYGSNPIPDVRDYQMEQIHRLQ